jgi:hydroxymethylbilane synthase
MLQKMNCSKTALAVKTEREFNAIVGGSCQIPAGCHVVYNDDGFKMYGFIAEIDGSEIYRAEVEGSLDELPGSGEFLANMLLEEGGDRIIKSILR